MKYVKKNRLQPMLWLALGLASQTALAGPSTLTYQGFLKDDADKPVDGTIEINFAIPGTGWAESYTGVLVKDGLFAILLGSKTTLKDVDFSEQRKLQITYNGTTQEVTLPLIEEEGNELPDCTKDQTIKFDGTNWVCVDSPSTGGGIGDSNGSVFIRWGNGTAPAGTTLLYSGYAFNSHYTHGGGGTEPICMKAGDVGAPGPGGYYGDLIYPVGTGDAARMPPGISAATKIKCAVVSAVGPSFEMWGSQSCPDGWQAAYKGYGMGAYYWNHGKSNRQCVDNFEYDYSVSNNNYGDLWYGTVLYTSADFNLYENDRYIKCARCVEK